MPIIWVLIKEHFNHIPLGLIMLVIIELLIEYGVVPRIELIKGLDIYLVGCYIGVNAEKFLECKNGILTIVSTIFIILVLLEKIFLISVGVNPVCALLDYLLMPWIVIGVLIIIAYFLQTYFPMVWKVLTGGRGIYKKT